MFFLAPLLAGLATWAPVIGTAVSAVGGLMSAGARRDHELSIAEAQSKPQVTTNTVDLAKMRADAEANGFNPLTVLRAGGMAGYGVQTSPALMARPTSPTSPVGEFLGGIGGMFGAFQEVRRNENEHSLVQAQIQNYNADTKAKSMMLRVPSYTAPTTETTKADMSGKSPGSYKVFGYELNMNPWWSSADDLEQWHGDSADLWAPLRFNDDLRYNAPRMWNDFTNWLGSEFKVEKIPEKETGGNAPPLRIVVDYDGKP